MRLLLLFGLVAFLAAGVSEATHLAASTRTIRYAVGGATENPVAVGPASVAACAGFSWAIVVGGACYIVQPAGSTALVTVWDDVQGAVPFWYAACEWPPATGGAWADGSAHVTLPPDCGALLVAPALGATVGIIQVTTQ